MDTSDYIAISSALIALSAMAVAVWQGYISRRHNILSVKPMLQIRTNTIVGLCLTLQNQGLGPARIKSFAITCGEMSFTNPSSDIYQEIFEYLGANPMEFEFGYEFHIPRPEGCYISGQSEKLLTIIPGSEKCTEAILQKINQSLEFKITYTSFYEEKEFICN